jgi:hypothetical protein
MAHSSTPSERPEARGDSARTCSGLVSSLLAAPQIAAAALVRIWRFIHPRGFGEDLFDIRMAERTGLVLDSIVMS